MNSISQAASTSLSAVRLAYSWSPVAVWGVVLATFLKALGPALQVWSLGYLVSVIGRGTPQSQLTAVGLVALVAASNITMMSLSQHATLNLGYRVQTRAQSAVAERVASLSPQEVASDKILAEVQTSRDAIQPLGDQASNTISVIGVAVTALTLFASITRFSTVAAFFVLAALVPAIFAFSHIATTQKNLWNMISKSQRRANYLSDQLLYQRSAIELLSLGTGHEIAELATHSFETVETLRLGNLKRIVRIEILSGLSTLLLLFGAVYFLVDGDSPGASAAAGVVGVISGISATRGAGYSVGQLVVQAVPVSELLRFLRRPLPASGRPPRPQVTSLDLHDVTYRYPQATSYALDHVSLRVQVGEAVAFVGRNGAGKTTCVNAIMNIIQPHSGAVMADDSDVSLLDHAVRQSLFGLLTQEFGRYELTVRQSLSLGSPFDEPGEDEMWRTLSDAGAADLVKSMPDGLDTQLGPQWGGVGISGGQWQRLSIARIYLRNSPIWILDEPTSAIDSASEAEIFDRLTENNDDRITIVVAHRASTLRRMDRIYVFSGGRIVEHGTYAELLERNGEFVSLFKEELA